MTIGRNALQSSVLIRYAVCASTSRSDIFILFLLLALMSACIALSGSTIAISESRIPVAQTSLENSTITNKGGANVSKSNATEDKPAYLVHFPAPFRFSNGNTYTVHIHPIKTADDDGTRVADINSEQVQQWVTRSNADFSQAGIQFQLDPIPSDPNWRPLANTAINNLDSYGGGWNEARETAAQFPSKLVVFFRHGYGIDANGNRHDDWHTGNGFSNPDLNFIAMPGFLHTSVIISRDDMGNWIWEQNIGQLSHDIGHYLALDHTFPGSSDSFTDSPTKAAQYIVDNGGTDSALDGDKLSDTPPDAGTSFYINQNWDPCVGHDSYNINGINNDGAAFSFAFTPDRHNIMSYFACEPLGFTQMQISKMRQALESRFQIAILGPSSFRLGGVGPPHLVPAGTVTLSYRSEMKGLSILQDPLRFSWSGSSGRATNPNGLATAITFSHGNIIPGGGEVKNIVLRITDPIGSTILTRKSVLLFALPCTAPTPHWNPSTQHCERFRVQNP